MIREAPAERAGGSSFLLCREWAVDCSDWRLATSTRTISGRYFFEEYKYDALGRRVAVIARRDCRDVP
jgi:YD repeat-containing protein